MKKNIPILIIFVLFLSCNSIEEIKYSLNRGFLGRFIDGFSVKFNKTGIEAEYIEAPKEYNIEEGSKGRKIYNLIPEDLGLPPLKELFKLFNKIDFPEETNWMEKIYDVPIWHLYVDDKDYTSNRGTEFLEKFDDIVNLTNIREYCKSRY